MFKDHSLQGMDCVIATVSGYHGSDRLNLTKLISQTGANCVGALTKSTTHLVCWKFEGKKYNLAKKLRTVVVNHRWIEDCIKAGKRIPENPYILHCGEEVGPITFEVQLAAKREIPSLQKNKVPPCQSSSYKLSRESLIDLDYRAVNPSILIGSNLLAEKREESSSHFSKPSVRHKRKICDYFPTTSSDTVSRSARRLVKGNKSIRTLNSEPSDSKQECFPQTTFQSRDNMIVLDIDSVASDNISGHPGATSNDTSYQCGGSGLEAESLTAPAKNNEVEDSMRLCNSIELSCVICWTNFSSTRGILQCGHRFCYSCIESWAKHMASGGKGSTCPLCKTEFISITKVDDVSSFDQKIYSQTAGDVESGKDVLLPHVAEVPNHTPLPPVCFECLFREPVDLLICCNVCQVRWVHSYCLDPPLFPWTCIHCRLHVPLY